MQRFSVKDYEHWDSARYNEAKRTVRTPRRTEGRENARRQRKNARGRQGAGGPRAFRRTAIDRPRRYVKHIDRAHILAHCAASHAALFVVELALLRLEPRV